MSKLPKILCITECATAIAHRGNAKLFEQTSNKMILHVASQLANVADFRYTYFSRSQFSDRSTLDTKAFTATKNDNTSFDLVTEAICKIKPDVVLLFGTKILPVLTTTSKRSQAMGKVLEFKSDVGYQCPVLSTYATGQVMANFEELNTAFVNDFVKAVELATGSERKHKLVDAKTPMTIIRSKKQFKKALDEVKAMGIFCHDIETSGLRYYAEDAYITCLGFCYQPGHTYILELYHHDTVLWAGFDELDEQVNYVYKKLVKEIFNNYDVMKIAHNVWFEAGWHQSYGLKDFHGRWEDTMFISHVLNELSPNGLKEITNVFVPAFAGYSEGVGGKGVEWGSIDFEVLLPYLAIDCDMTMRLWYILSDKLLKEDANGKMYLLYRNYLCTAFKALSKMSFGGLRIDLPAVEVATVKMQPEIDKLASELASHPIVKKFRLRKLKEARKVKKKEYKAKIKQHKAKMAETGRSTQHHINNYYAKLQALKHQTTELFELNFQSNPQLQSLFYDEGYFELPIAYDHKKKKPKKSTERDWIMQFIEDHDRWFFKFLAFKSLNKTVNNYYRGFLKLSDADGYLHGDYNVRGTKTGRCSSKNPNLQNVTWFTKIEHESVRWATEQVRTFFINEKPNKYVDEYIMCQADYSQMELRLIANFSGDPMLQKAYLDGIDVHSITAAKIVNMTLDEFKAKADTDKPFHKRFRTVGKIANFSIVYGISTLGYIDYVFRMTGNKYTEKVAQGHIDAVMTLYSGLGRWHKDYNTQARDNQYVRTLFGTKRRFPEINTTTIKKHIAECYRQSINSPIQGTSGEMCLFALTIVDLMLFPHLGRIMNTIHDSIFSYLAKKHVKFTCSLIDEIAANPPIEDYLIVDKSKLVVSTPLDFELSSENWSKMKEVEKSDYISELPRIK